MLDTNIEIFAIKNPKAAVLLSYVDSPKSLGETLQGAEAWAKKLPIVDIESLVVFGIGLGYGYDALQKWLHEDKNRQLIFVDDDLSVLLHFLESDKAHELLCDPQVHLFYIEDSEVGLQVLQSIAWATYGKKFFFTSLPLYEQERKQTYDDIKARLDYEASDIHIVLDEYMGYGVSFFRNFWKNLFLLPGSYRGNKLRGAFRGIPAICVAAGPSLEQHLDLLKTYRDKALIFSGGSSVNALLEAGIQPHFGAGIDPNPLQYMRFRQALGFQVPFFFRGRLLNESLKLIQSPRLYLKGGDGYNISDWFEEKLKIPGHIIGGGHSIANFIIEIAHTLGCSPIILVGYDLAYGKKLERYAPGIEHASEAAEEKPIEWKDALGKTVHTAWKWLLEAKWIEDYAQEKPKPKIINATEGGLGLKKIPHMSLKEVQQKFFGITRDLDSLVHTAIQEAGLIAEDTQKVLQGCSQMYDSLEQVKTHLNALIEATKSMTAEQFHASTDMVLLQAQLKEEIAYKYILEVFDRMRVKLEYYRLQFAGMSLEMTLLHERYLFLKDTAIINQLLIAQSVQEQQAKGCDIKAFSPKAEVLWT